MTHPDQPNADAFWNDHGRRGRAHRTERTREHTAITKRTRRPKMGAAPIGPQDATPPVGPGLFDDIPDDPFADDFGLGTYAGLTGHASAAEPPPVDHEIVLEPTRRRAAGGIGIDPLLARLGAIIVAAVIAVPIVGAFGGKGDADDSAGEIRSEQESTTASTQPRKKKRVTTTSAAMKATADDGAGSAGATGPLADSPMGPAPDDGDSPDTSAIHGISPTTRPACAAEYEVVAGDYWLRLADASGSDLDDLLAVNGATVDTPLYPGSEICLPAGATTPEPPTTEAPAPTTPAPTTPAPTDPPTTDPPTTPAPTDPPTTPAPTDPPPTPAPTDPPTTPAPTDPPPPPGSVPEIIRSVFPDHLEERALEIAWRESNYIPTARNYCCYGLFQIYYDAHKSWLPSVGVNSAEDLFDPYKNARAAYTLYQRSGGWSPWNL